MAVTDATFNPSASAHVDRIKKQGVIMEHYIRENTKEGRLQSIALTHLETALMYAVKSAATEMD